MYPGRGRGYPAGGGGIPPGAVFYNGPVRPCKGSIFGFYPLPMLGYYPGLNQLITGNMQKWVQIYIFFLSVI